MIKRGKKLIISSGQSIGYPVGKICVELKLELRGATALHSRHRIDANAVQRETRELKFLTG